MSAHKELKKKYTQPVLKKKPLKPAISDPTLEDLVSVVSGNICVYVMTSEVNKSMVKTVRGKCDN